MSKDNVDLTIEEMFGFSISEGSSSKEAPTSKPKKAHKPPPIEDEEEIDVLALLTGGDAESTPKPKKTRLSDKEMAKLLTGETPAPKPGKVSDTPSEPHKVLPPSKEPGSPLDAAQAVRDAVVAHEGKRRSVDSWKDIARDVLQLGRLTTKRWENVLKVGVDAGLFRIDDTTLSYPHLIPLDPEPEVDPEPDVDPEPEVKPRPRRDLPTRPPEDESEPTNPPRSQPCGHLDFLGDVDHEKHVAARAEGKCCAYASRGHIRQWEMVREPYLSTLVVPKGRRRDGKKVGFPGYCTDDEGHYIGGQFNDCRYHLDEEGKPVPNPRETWCATHQKEGK